MHNNSDNFRHLIRKHSESPQQGQSGNSFKNQPKDEHKFTDSLSNYVKNSVISESQVILVRELLKRKDPAKARELKSSTMSILINDSNIGVRKMIAWAYQFPASTKDSVVSLSSRLEKERNWIVKQEIISSLVEIGSAIKEKNDLKFTIMGEVFAYLNDNRHPVRISAIHGVIKLGITEARYKIQEMSATDPVQSVREKARLAFEKISEESL